MHSPRPCGPQSAPGSTHNAKGKSSTIKVGHSGVVEDFANDTEIAVEMAKPTTSVKETNFFQFMVIPNDGKEGKSSINR
jgi:hypothetical protein